MIGLRRRPDHVPEDVGVSNEKPRRVTRRPIPRSTTIPLPPPRFPDRNAVPASGPRTRTVVGEHVGSSMAVLGQHGHSRLSTGDTPVRGVDDVVQRPARRRTAARSRRQEAKAVARNCNRPQRPSGSPEGAEGAHRPRGDTRGPRPPTSPCRPRRPQGPDPPPPPPRTPTTRSTTKPLAIPSRVRDMPGRRNWDPPVAWRTARNVHQRPGPPDLPGLRTAGLPACCSVHLSREGRHPWGRRHRRTARAGTGVAYPQHLLQLPGDLPEGG